MDVYRSDIGLERLSYINQKLFYQHQNITIVIKGESETLPISEIAMIILSLRESPFNIVVVSLGNKQETRMLKLQKLKQSFMPKHTAENILLVDSFGSFAPRVFHQVLIYKFHHVIRQT